MGLLPRYLPSFSDCSCRPWQMLAQAGLLREIARNKCQILPLICRGRDDG